jgi:hypothetical protein
MVATLVVRNENEAVVRPAGVWSQVVGFFSVLQLSTVAVKMFLHLIYFKKKLYTFLPSVRFAKIMLQ